MRQRSVGRKSETSTEKWDEDAMEFDHQIWRREKERTRTAKLPSKEDEKNATSQGEICHQKVQKGKEEGKDTSTTGACHPRGECKSRREASETGAILAVTTLAL
jgi:hypothetical protein